MDYIIKGTTPTITLTVIDDIPEGAIPTVTVRQGDSSFNPEIDFDPVVKTVSFALLKSYTDALSSDEYLVIQQFMSFPDGTIERFPEHLVEVMEMLYIEPEKPEEIDTEVVSYMTEDTSVNQETEYFSQEYIVTPSIFGENPLNMGLYEEDDDEYFPTQDVEFLEDKVYYTKQLVLVEPVGNENPSEEGWFIVVSPKPVEESEIKDSTETGDDTDKYTPVIPENGDNPYELGWFIINDDGYFEITTDTVVDQEVIYYEVAKDDYMDNADHFFKDFDEAFYASMNGLTSSDDDEPEEYKPYVYIALTFVNHSGDHPDNPSENQWYEFNEGNDEYVLSADTYCVIGKTYYRQIDNSGWDVDANSVNVEGAETAIPEEDFKGDAEFDSTTESQEGSG